MLKKEFNIILGLIFAGLMGYLIIFEIVQFDHGFVGDFFHFYQAAKALIHHQYLYSSGNGGYIYIPFFAFLITPLTYFSQTTACIIWQILNFIFLFVILNFSFKLLAKFFQLNFNKWQVVGACSLTIILCFNQLWWEIKWCQTDLLILLGITLGLYWLSTKPILSGWCFGIVGNIKYITFFLLPLFILRARWRVIIGILIGLLIGLFLPAIMIGWKTNLHYLLIALRGLKDMPGHQATILVTKFEAKVPEITWRVNISITSGLVRLFTDHGWLLREAFIISMSVAFSFFLILWRIFNSQSIPFIWRTPSKLGNIFQENVVIHLECIALLVCLLIFSPQCTLRHMIILLNLHLLAVVLVLFPRKNVKRWPAVMAILIYQFGRIFNNTLLMGHHHWEYIGGPSWALLIALPLIIYNSLKYCQDVFKLTTVPQNVAALPQRK
jgi:Glycosyltransferase family 87